MIVIKKLASAAVVGALFALPLAGHAQQSPGTLMKDSVITTKIKAAQASDKTVSATKINVETDNSGKVILSGTAKTQAEIDRAVELAKGIEGVQSVQNNMTLAGATAVSTTPATTATTTQSTTPMATDTARSQGTMPMATDTARAPRMDRN